MFLLTETAGVLLMNSAEEQLRPAVADAARRLGKVHYLGYLEGRPLVDAFASASMVVAPSRKDPAPLVASEALAAGRPLVLGPGVANAGDLRRLSPEAVSVMTTASASDLISVVSKVLGRAVTPAARAAFTPRSCAQAYLRGVEIYRPESRRSGRPYQNGIQIGLREGGP